MFISGETTWLIFLNNSIILLIPNIYIFMSMDESRSCEVNLPGFRFHPTEEELLSFYLKTMVFGLAKIGEREWYFFVPRDKKHGSGGRPNRTTENGFWKATGSDRQIHTTSDPKKVLGLKKTLVFYEGRAPRGTKTDWVMNEFRLPDKCSPPKDIVLCKIYRKATSLKVLEYRAAVEEDEEEEEIKSGTNSSSLSPPMDCMLSFSNQFEEINNIELKKENEEILLHVKESSKVKGCSSIVLPNGSDNIAELQVPKFNTDWTQDSFWTQFSPWLDNFAPFLPMC
ncbi:hypothetical protein ABFS83_02G002700 [Erythranthe nasuta]